MDSLEARLADSDCESDPKLVNKIIEFARVNESAKEFNLTSLVALTKQLGYIIRKYPKLVKEDFTTLCYNSMTYNQEGIERIDLEMQGDITPDRVLRLLQLQAYFHSRGGEAAKRLYVKNHQS